MHFPLELNTKENNIKKNNMKGEEGFKVAFLILTHKNPSQIVSFVNSLDCEDVSFFIHVNVNSDIADHSVLEEIKSKENVFFIEQRQKSTWGGYGIINATLLLLKKCLEKDKYDYISLHSGQDLPIKNKNEILDFLRRNQGKEFVEFFKIPSKGWWPDNGFDRIEYYWFVEEIGLEKAWELYEVQKKSNVKRKCFKNIQHYGGSAWWTITRECAQFIIIYVNKNKNYYDYYKYTFITAEAFFHTIILNSYFKDRVVNNDLTYLEWQTGRPHPKIFTKYDYEKLINSDKLFARKFDTNVDNEIIKMITNRIM